MSVLDTAHSVSSLRPTLQVYTDPWAAKNQLFNPTDAPDFIPRLMQVCDQLNDEGLWKGVYGIICYNGTTTGYITLPRRYYTIEGATIGGAPRLIFTEYNQFKDMGLGYRPAQRYNQMGLTEDEDGHCTYIDLDPSQPSQLQLQYNPLDTGVSVRFSGTDGNGDQIFDESGDSATGSEGITVVTDGSGVITTSQIFSDLEHIVVSSGTFKYPWTLWGIIKGAWTQLSRYEPGEQVPRYKRYKVGKIWCDGSKDPNHESNRITVYCKRRLIPLVFETDLVFPGAQRALGLGLQALNFENIAGDIRKGNAYWAEAIDNLNKKIRSASGRTNKSIPFRVGFDNGPKRMW